MLYIRKYKKQRVKIKITSSVLQMKNMFVSCYSIQLKYNYTEKGFSFKRCICAICSNYRINLVLIMFALIELQKFYLK